MSLETYESGNVKGFTLIEVLIALVIVSLCFAAVMYSMSNASQNYLHVRDKTAATWVASNVLAQAQTNQLHGSTTGIEIMLGKEWSWELSVKLSSNPAINELQVRVDDRQSGKQVTQLLGYMESTP